jgi:2-polyprenyl-3-methyl-5-hydroxy-6-metoxy-1,4-benzoquinol methylase
MMVDIRNSGEFTAEELESVLACPSCEVERGVYRYEALIDHLEDVPGHWCMRECTNCGCLFLDPRPKPDAIAKAYRSYHTHSRGSSLFAQDNGNSFLWRLANGYMNFRYGSNRIPAMNLGRIVVPLLPPIRQQLDYFYRHLPKGCGRLLDVGCGNGVFLRRARDAGWHVAGVEPDALAVEASRGDGLNVRQGTLDDYYSSEPFDAITCAHVIEHVHDPRRFVQQVHSLLRTHGRIWLATPNIQSLGHKFFGKAWRGLEPPRHLTLFSARALHALLRDAGFVDIRFRCRGRGARYMIRSSREIARLEGMTVKGLWPLFIDIRATISTAASEELIVTAQKQ